MAAKLQRKNETTKKYEEKHDKRFVLYTLRPTMIDVFYYTYFICLFL